jgi:hypothetical protein
VWEKPSHAPKDGNRIAASTLKKKMTEIACATSSLSASITGAVAAIAEPPQIEEPTPIRVDMFDGMCITLWSAKAMISEAVIVPIIIGSDCFPVSNTTERFNPKPKRITAYCRIFFEVNLMPESNLFVFLINRAIIIPIIIAITGLPIMGKFFPSNHDGIAIIKQSAYPSPFFLIKFIFLPSFYIWIFI